MTKEMTKPLPISKWMVYNSYQKVIAQDGRAGIDKRSIEQFHEDLSGNLDSIWNRMTSDSYFPPPVLRKQSGKISSGIPAVSDHIAQGVIRDYLEPSFENIFHSSSFGYRSGRNTHSAIKQCRNNCIKYAWMVDVYIKGLFDNVNHDIMLQLLQQHTQEKWIMLFAERWLKPREEQEDGSIGVRTKGIPQGGTLNQLFANIYMHHSFDKWMDEVNTQNPFERYADNIVVHCSSKEEAELLLEKLKARMQEYELELHPKKTKIKYCKNYQWNDKCGNNSFTFWSDSFQQRIIKTIFHRKNRIALFNAAIGQQAKTSIKAKLRAVLMCYKLS